MLLNLITGVLIGLGSSVLLYTLHFQGLLRTPLGGRLLMGAMLIHAVGLLAALWRHRSVGGFGGEVDVPFIRLFGAGLVISLIAGLVVAQGSWLFIQVVDPTYLEWIRERSLEALAASPAPAAEKAQQAEAIRATTPLGYATQGLMGTLFFGLLLSLTLAALLRIRVLRTATTA